MTLDLGSFLAMLATQASADPAYLGWVLARFQEAEGVSSAALAVRLRADPVSLRDLALCLRPRQEAFAADVRAIAERFAVDDTSLAMLIRHIEVLERMRASGTASADQGLLLAARMRPRHVVEPRADRHQPPPEAEP